MAGRDVAAASTWMAHRSRTRRSQRICTLITAEQLAQLEAVADRYQLSLSDVVRECLHDLPRAHQRLRKRARMGAL